MTREEIEREVVFADMVLNVIKNVKTPMLVYDEEKAVVTKALNEYKYKLEYALAKQIYKQGLNDAWKAARKVFDIWFKTCHHSPNEFNIFWELDGITGDDIFDLFFKRYSVSEVIEKLREMEDNG